MTHGITSTGMLAYGPYYLYGYSLAVLPTKKLSSLATPNDRNIVVLGVAPANPPGADRPLMLSDSFSVIGIAAGNEAVERLGRDGFYNTYSAELLGISVSWSGSLFQIGSSGGPRAVSNATIETPYGQYATLNLLGISVRGDHPLQHFVVNYTDATSQTFEQSISDWHSAQNYAGEAIAALMAYRVASSGVHQPGPFDLYGYAFSLDKSKTIW